MSDARVNTIQTYRLDAGFDPMGKWVGRTQSFNIVKNKLGCACERTSSIDARKTYDAVS